MIRGAVHLRPQHTFCISELCKEKRHRLTEERSVIARLYMLCQGILPISPKNLYCRFCETRYYHNYRVEKYHDTETNRDGTRRIYEDYMASDIYQITQSQWVHRELMDFFQAQMAFSHASAESICRIYNAALAHPTGVGISGGRLKDEMGARLVYDAFFTLSCWHSLNERGFPFVTPNHDDLHARLLPPLRLQNHLMRGTGQEMWAHRCKGCMKMTRIDGVARFSTAGVTDGVTIGHNRCTIEGVCMKPLQNSQSQFCEEHSYKGEECFILDCCTRRLHRCMSCGNPDHMAAEEALPQNTRKSIMENLRHFEHAAGVASSSADDESPHLHTKKYVARKVTHNDQLVVYACGIIAARTTMYNSEGIVEVKNFLKSVFPAEYPGAMPSFLFYDNNCQLLQHLTATGDLHFARCGLPVDVFHFRKHKDSDSFCALYCNPAKFPELLSHDGHDYVFNSSVAEQVNRWYGRFQAITREMSADRYNFYLDEMIAIRNQWLVQQLRLKGWCPLILPMDILLGRD
ncbi:uncharacterized protein EV420DRAFT_1275786 [Desarmillaria tabescens]|uniref:CxC6 like cysteine cluster associated with KDZ domain-containing protein n=1 Tax=Armillaria tabescens TaxID=1929756 RepID=A0AA39JSR6_ARMTA|nr:uncharacterized protein EV420DRAFT_1275786 [Desarmillaria tabescens]KAK0448251.1 hypothetical protein EV420DRAFT_1275786 [Desarmillaria tabescens]